MHFMRGGPPHGKVELAYSEPFFGSLRSLHPLTLSFGMVHYAHYIFLQCSLLCSPYSFAALTLYTNITHYML